MKFTKKRKKTKKKIETEFKGRKPNRKKLLTERELVNLYAEKICRNLWGPSGVFWVDRDTATVRTKSSFDFIFMGQKLSLFGEAKRSFALSKKAIFNLLTKVQQTMAIETRHEGQNYFIFEFVLDDPPTCEIYFVTGFETLEYYTSVFLPNL